MVLEPVLRVENLAKRFGPVHALGGVSANFHAGKVVAIVGENGAGKSTLLRIIEGEHQPDSGMLSMGGEAVHIRSPREAHALGIRIIHQEPEIVPEMTVAENIFVGDFKTTGGIWLDRSDLRCRTVELLDNFGISGALDPGRKCANLGPAQRQLIEIMRALKPGARVVAFDEPTASLTEEESSRLFAVIRRLKAHGVAILYISHRLREILDLADECLVLRDGRSVACMPMVDLDEAQMVRMMVGRPISDLFGSRERCFGDVALRLEGVTTNSIKDVTLDIRTGEIVGLAGLIGAGRTEVARAIIGMDAITKGVMTLAANEPYAPDSPADAIRACIGLVPEDRRQHGLLLGQTVRENVSLLVPERISKFGFIAPRSEKELARVWIDRLRIKTPSAEQLVAKLSGGNQQKVIFARWQARGPKILILDEPTRGIDVGAKLEIYRLVEMLASEGMAILLISSELPEILGLSDRIYVMRAGCIAGQVSGETATEENILELARAN
ncbi:sugar ABC transporter ATP-binding protein [Bradyrhizobium sp. CCBAU 53338]|uniref:sugar ABC transporter ATP-binding protein n=1 Tax=Bradyrhizobium sp. CCBAU 53338 TaxID=1325111 RepID=UPI00188A993D|nr:sugar ABC transporter ATP-binding protein [Bradyrhizobium sp. CCBAU 53338]QOZ52487.1 sugar ABC transporter ATP-binding protein [Bradyrhizobium sp. CCBAU 53338]